MCISLFASVGFAGSKSTLKDRKYVFGQGQQRGEESNQQYQKPYKRNAYGHGVNSDATGKPFQWKTNEGQVYRGEVKQNGYGMGVGQDKYGRPVKPFKFK